jgi:MFS family permease
MIDGDKPAPSKAWVLLITLSLGYACSVASRDIISLLVEPIKSDLSFSDTQIGLLQGFAFLAFYSVAGIPAGMMIDRLPRIKLLVMAISLWSLMTAFSGMARSFGQLFLTRAGLGVGEAFLSPAALSLISDVFPKRRHGLAIGIYVGGSLIGSSIAVGFGGLLYGWMTSIGAVELPVLGHMEPWQMTFSLMAIPGFLIALIFLLMSEPPRGMQAQVSGGGIWDFYRENRRFIFFHHAANGFTNLLALGVTAWGASYLIRSFGSDVQTVGPLLGFAFLGGGIVGMIGGGALSDILLRHGGEQARLWMCAGSAALGAVAASMLSSVGSVYAGALLIGIIVMFGSVPYSAANAALQQILPSQIRGTASAVYFFGISVLGAIGPSAVAFVTDYVFGSPARLSASLSIVVTVAFLISMLLYMLAIPPYRRVLRRMEVL